MHFLTLDVGMCNSVFNCNTCVNKPFSIELNGIRMNVQCIGLLACKVGVKYDCVSLCEMNVGER